MAEMIMSVSIWKLVTTSNDSKGYGFIQRQDGTDVFVHYSAIQSNGFKSLKEGQDCEFVCVKGKKGWQAEEVTIVS